MDALDEVLKKELVCRYEIELDFSVLNAFRRDFWVFLVTVVKILCVNLVRLWHSIVWSNISLDAAVKDFVDVVSTYSQFYMSWRLYFTECVGLIQSVDGPKSKNRFLKDEGILPQEYNNLPRFQPVGPAGPHNHMSQ